MLELTVARGTEGECYKCGKKITAGQFIVFKPNFHTNRIKRDRSKVAVHESCAPTKLKKHGSKTR